jgi:multidrug efflux pump subunit AcrA (membrane-fusion protein)
MSRARSRYETIGLGLIRILFIAFLVPAGAAEAADDTRVYRGMAVSIARIERHCFTNIVQASGFLVPRSVIDVRPEQEGLKVAQILVEPGDTVVAGQILVRLNEPERPQGQTVIIRSPVNGVAVTVSATLGAYASPGAPKPLVQIIVNGELELKGEVFASGVARLRPDQPAVVNVIGIGPVPGRVVAIGTEIDAKTQLGSVRLSVQADPRLRSGTFARAEIDTGQSCGLAIPLTAILYGREGAVIQVVDGDRIETRHVEVGLLEKGLAEIRDGLSPSDLVVARAGAFLREGDRVRPMRGGQ